MPKSIIFFLFSTFLLSTILSSCKKYPEDEYTSFKRPKKRLEGSWKLSSFLVDGKDSLSFWLSSGWNTCQYYNFEYDNSPSGLISFPTGTDGGDFWSDCSQGPNKGGFSIPNKDTLVLSSGFYYKNSQGLPTQGATHYFILKLDKTQLKIKAIVNQKTRILVFDRI